MKQILILTALFCYLGSCSLSNSCNADNPQRLIGDIQTYMSITDFKTKFVQPTDSVEIFEDSRFPATDQRPEFSNYTLILHNHKLEGHKGNLKVSFYNNRLISITFYPDKLGEFVEYLKNKHSIELEEFSSEQMHCISITRYTDFEDKEYISWTDNRLRKEQNNWISKYS